MATNPSDSYNFNGVAQRAIQKYRTGDLESLRDACNALDDLMYPFYAATGWLPLPGSSYAHIVVDDYNLDDGSVDFCLQHKEEWLDFIQERAEKYEGGALPNDYALIIEGYTAQVDEFLLWIKTIPTDVREQD